MKMMGKGFRSVYRMKERIISIVLTVAMILGMMPVSAAAGEGDKYVEALHFYCATPAVGKILPVSFNLAEYLLADGSIARVRDSESGWLDASGNLLDDNTVAQKDTVYKLKLVVEGMNEHKIDNSQLKTIIINNNKYTVGSDNTNKWTVTFGDNEVTIIYEFTATNTYINNIAIYIDPPSAYETPQPLNMIWCENTAAGYRMTDLRYFITSYKWFDSMTEKEMSSSDRFENNKRYMVELELTPVDGYHIDETHTTDIRLNGKTVGGGSYANGSLRYDPDRLTIRYNFVAQLYVDNVNIMIPSPKTGQSFPGGVTSFDAYVPGYNGVPGIYYIENYRSDDMIGTQGTLPGGMKVEVHWYKGDELAAVDTTKPVEPSTTYTINVVVTGIDGIKFMCERYRRTEGSFNGDGWFYDYSESGKSDASLENRMVSFNPDNNTMTITYTFPETAEEATDPSGRKLISQVNVNLENGQDSEPVTGAVATTVTTGAVLDTSYDAQIDNKAEIVSAFGGTEGNQIIDLTDGDRVLASGDTFTYGHKYRLKLHCKAKSATKYYFDDSTIVRINGKLATKTIADISQGDITYSGYHLWITYDFIATGYNRVTFHMQGHGEEIHEQGVENGGTATEPERPLAEGYTFGGWFTEPNGGDLYSFTETSVMRDLDLYAHWTVNKYNMYYDLDGATDQAQAQNRFQPRENINYGTDFGVAYNPNQNDEYMKNLKKDGYVFEGWDAYKVEEVTDEGIVLGEKLEQIPSSMPDFDLCWKAHFASEMYSLSYRKTIRTEDGSVSISDINWDDLTWLDADGNELSAEDIEESFTKYSLEKDGFKLPVLKAQRKYTFAGWYLGVTEDSAKVEKIEKGNSALVPENGKILNLYPRFKLSEFKLEWALDGGMISEESGEYTPSGKVTYGDKIIFPEVFKPYYDLTYWKITYKSGAVLELTPEALEVKQASEDPVIMTDEDMVITTVWIMREYQLKCVLDPNIARWNTWKDEEVDPSAVEPSWSPSREPENEGVAERSCCDFFLFNTMPALKGASHIHMLEGENGTPSPYVFAGWYKTYQYGRCSLGYRQSTEFLSNPKQAPNREKYDDTAAGRYLYEYDLRLFQNDGWDEADLVTSMSQQILDELDPGQYGIRFYARFKKKELTLTWNFQGATVPAGITYSPAIESSNSIKIESMQQIVLPAGVEKTGYEFKGWQFFIDGESGEITEPETMLEYDKVAGTLKMPSQSLTIKAKLIPKQYVINYDLNGFGQWKSASAITPPWSDLGEGNDKYTVESYKSDKLREVDKHMSVTPGYEFVGWYDLDGGYGRELRALDPDIATDSDYIATKIGNPIRNLRDVVDLTQPLSVKDYNLIAIWKRVSYNVTWDLDGGRVDGDQASSFAPAFTNYLATDVSVVKAKYSDTIKAPDITGCKEGYTFRGWQFTGVDSLGSYQSGTYYKSLEAEMPATDVEFKAYWSLNEYRIQYIYDAKQGSLADSTVFTYDYETSVEIPDMIPDYENPKYEFKGWYTKRPTNYNDNDAIWDETARVTNIPINSTGNVTLYARWYTKMVNLTWNMDNGTVMTSSAYTKSDDYEFGTGLRFPTAGEMSKIGYDFNGWIIQAYSDNVKVDEAILGAGEEIPARFKTIKNNLVIVARWNLVQYTINYYFGVDENGNPIADYTSSQKKSVRYVYTVEDDTYAIMAPTVNNRPDVKFTAWYTAKPDGFDNTPGWLITTWDSKTLFDTIVKGSRTGALNLYARWEMNQNYANTINTQIKDINTAIRKLMELVYADNSFEMTPDLESRLKTAIGTFDTSWYAVKYGTKRDEIADYDRLRLVEQKFKDNVSRMTQEIVDDINAIGDVTYSDAVKERLSKARETYNKNTQIVEIKNALANEMPKAASILAEKEAVYAALAEKDQKDNAKADNVIELAKKIPSTVELSDAHKDLIYDALDSYEALTSDQKALIPANVVKRMNSAADQYQGLVAQRAEDQKKANEAINAIDSISDKVKLTDEDKAKIEAARKAYDSLTSDQKALVPEGKVNTLKNSEDAYDKLVKKKEKADYNAAYKKWDKKNTTEKEITKKIRKTNTDVKDVKGAKFAKLKPKAKGGKNQVTLTWKKVKKANGYLVYGAQYGGKMKLLATLKGKKKTKYVHKNLAGNSYYKYIVVAYKNVKKFNAKSVLAVSTTVYAAPSNSEYGNPLMVKNRGVLNVTQANPGDVIQLLINVQFPGKDKPIRDVRYESTNKKVATVDKSGKIVCKKAGKATIYAVGQNGMFASLKVTVVK